MMMILILVMMIVIMILIHGDENDDEDEADHCYIVVQWISTYNVQLRMKYVDMILMSSTTELLLTQWVYCK